MASAIQIAGTVSGAYSASPCAFVPLPSTSEPLLRSLRPDGASRGAWLMVTVRATKETGQQVHLHERCLTAVQRIMLALACDGIESAWVTEGLPDATAFGAAGVDLVGRTPIGLVWYAAE